MKLLKPYMILLVLSLLLAGCVPPKLISTSIYNMDLNGERTANMGDIFFNHHEGQAYEGAKEPYFPFYKNAFQFELTVVELTDQKIGLQYTEYTKVKNYIPAQSYGMLIVPATTSISDWVVKQGFNKRLDYSTADKIIRFRDYEFEILSVDKGQVKYRRIK